MMLNYTYQIFYFKSNEFFVIKPGLCGDVRFFSIISFQGRGFFPSLSSETNLHNPLVMLAAAEAIIGLLIEISFIATFTQRFFGK